MKRVIKLPLGLKRRLDLRQYSTLSEEHRILPTFELMKVGHKRDNVGIVAFSARRMPEQPLKFAIYVEIHNFGKGAVEGFLELYIDGTQIETVNLKIAAQKGWRRTFSPLSSEGQRLEARLHLKRGNDFLKADNRSFAI